MESNSNIGELRVGLVGVGQIAQSHLAALASVDVASLSALVDNQESVVAPVAREAHVSWFTDYLNPGLLPLVDAVVVCVPPSLHGEIAGYFLSHGVHVLCEKPLAPTSSEARRLADTAHRHDRILMMASKFRYVGDIVRAKEIIESGALGEITAFENVFSSRVDMMGRWNSVPEVSGGGVLMDNGPHSVDIARCLLGPIERVHALAAPPLQDLGVEDTARLHFLTRAGVFGSVDLSWSVDKAGEDYVKVYGTGGALLVGWQGSRRRKTGDSEWTVFGSGYQKATAFEDQISNFAGVIVGTASPRVDMEDALASVEVVEAAYRSLAQNTWASVDERS